MPPVPSSSPGGNGGAIRERPRNLPERHGGETRYATKKRSLPHDPDAKPNIKNLMKGGEGWKSHRNENIKAKGNRSHGDKRWSENGTGNRGDRVCRKDQKPPTKKKKQTPKKIV